MAGMGKRMRPHTLTVPKPLIPVAGKPIVQHLVEDIAAMVSEPITEIAYVTGRFGHQVEQDLIQVAESLGAKGSIYYQDEALGTAHAILCAEEVLEGKVIVAFADTLFRADFQLDESKDAVLFVQQIDDPSQFGVVAQDEQGHITDFVEKPIEFVSDLAMIGIYFFRDGAVLRSELQYLIDHDVRHGGEYQLPDGLRNMMKKGMKLVVGQVEDWMDCGNKQATVETNKRMLGYLSDKELVSDKAVIVNSVIIPPCFIAEGVRIENSVVGPYVSLGKGSHLSRCLIRNSIIQSEVELKDLNSSDSMIGNHAKASGASMDLNLSDYSTFKG